MAKESMKAREVKRAKLVARYAEKRAALKQIVRTGEPADAFEAAQKLQELPKNSNPIRMHNRCKLTGRPKGYIRQFGLSRIQFRELASNGLLPGVKNASWSLLFKSCQGSPDSFNLFLYSKSFRLINFP